MNTLFLTIYINKSVFGYYVASDHTVSKMLEHTTYPEC